MEIPYEWEFKFYQITRQQGQATWLPVKRGERADPSRIMGYAEANPKADMQYVIFHMSRFFSIQNATK